MELMESLKKNGLKIGEALMPSEKKTGDMDILDKLKQEHDEVSVLLAELVEAKTAPRRKALLKQIKKSLVPHVRAEEKIVYNVCWPHNLRHWLRDSFAPKSSKYRGKICRKHERSIMPSLRRR